MMHDYFSNDWTKELCGYLASILVLLTFSMKSMRWLRLTAITSNIAFILYAWMMNLHPVFVLHGILLPLNVFRLAQIEIGRRHSVVIMRPRSADHETASAGGHL